MQNVPCEGEDKRQASLDVEADVERILAEMRDALERVRSLGTLVSVCGSCKGIRDLDGRWRTMEEFLCERLRVQLSHGLCPCCGERLLAELEATDSGRGVQGPPTGPRGMGGRCYGGRR